MAHNIKAPFLFSSFQAALPAYVAHLQRFVKFVGDAPWKLFCNEESPFSRCPIFIYRPARRYDVQSFAQARLQQGVSYSLSVPRTPGRHPLIVYLTARSEPANFSQELHRAWVEAGYALVVVSPESHTSPLQAGHPDVIDGEYVRLIRSLLEQLRERDGAPFDRNDFQTVVIAGAAISANDARMLSAACNCIDPLGNDADFPDLLLIADEDTRQFSGSDLAGASPGHGLVIAVPGGNGHRGMIRHDFHPLSAPGERTHAADLMIPKRAAIRHLSLGFLDATVKRDQTAIEWLKCDAGRWLEPVGDLHYG